MGIFDKWREARERRRQAVNNQQRPVRLTINYTTLKPVDPLPYWAKEAFALSHEQLVIVAPWSLIKPYVFDEAKKEELRNIPGFDSCVLEILQ